MSGPSVEPPRLVRWWEGLATRTQIAVAAPALSLVLFAANLVAFSQPLLRSIFYGLFEGGIATGLLIAATLQEKSRRGSR